MCSVYLDGINNLCLEMSQENSDNFVSIHYIICECGETFPSENSLKTHLEKEHPSKREKKQYKCGIVSKSLIIRKDLLMHHIM